MPVRLSRRKLANYAADKLTGGASPKAALHEIAAYLVETRRIREYELVVRDIEDALASRGIVVADVTSAQPLNDDLKQSIANIAGGSSVQLRQTVDESVLGGMRLSFPGKQLDATLRHKLNALRAQKL